MTDTLRRIEIPSKVLGIPNKYEGDDDMVEVVLAADVERVVRAYKKQCECRYCGGHHLNISVCSKCGFANKDAPHFIQQAHAIAAALEAADRMIIAQDKLLVAYRLGSSQRAGKAIDELESARKAYDTTKKAKP